MMRKICIVITARPSYSRVKTLLNAVKENSTLELQLVVTASALLYRYGCVEKTIDFDGFKIDDKIFNIIEGESLTTSAKTTGLGIIELATTFEKLKPDIVVTVADRFETMATAIAASYMNIPLAHIQGGEVTGNIDEKVRHSITKLADYHFVSSKDAKLRVIRLGENPKYVFNTGCPSIDIAARIAEDQLLKDDINIVGVGEDIYLNSDYIIVLQHPVTTEYGDSFEQINKTLNVVSGLEIPTLWFWPNVDSGSDGISKGIREFREKKNKCSIKFIKNLEPEEFLKLLYNTKCLVGNSSVGIREASFLGVPVANIGTRQNGRTRGRNVVDVDHNELEIKNAILKQISNGRYETEEIYGDGNAGDNIAKELEKLPLVFKKTLQY
ncbi:UDP-N-acetylglucosamine 2-epimerase [Verrucomicrobia bacterium]|nr:UDP-N-acetylglucosamine 2-epimerase [Verrucomicrobiota bacterium]